MQRTSSVSALIPYTRDNNCTRDKLGVAMADSDMPHMARDRNVAILNFDPR